MIAGQGQTILIFSDDWGRHPSSCQHLARRLLRRHRVVWVNTIGMRAPQFSALTVLRGFEKIRQWVGKPAVDRQPLPENLEVLNPKMWPWMRTRFDRSLNRRLLTRQLLPRLQELHPPAVAITTVPIAADLIGQLPIRRWLYYCVDDFSAWPGLDQAAMDRLERDLVARVECCVAVSETLQERLAGMGAASHLLMHGVDAEFWTSPHANEPLPSLANLEKPFLVFWGLKDKRLDLEFLGRLSASLQKGSILLVGPENDPAPELRRLPRVHSIAPLPFEHLPRLGAEASVLIMPYADLPVTRAMQPLKLKEYLATGRPVVARNLPSLHDWSDCADLVDSPEEFARRVETRMLGGIPPGQAAARSRLTGESWDAKAEQLEHWLFPGISAPTETEAAHA